VTIEAAVAGQSEAWVPVVTDAEGRFELKGLTDRAYRLTIMNPWTLAHLETDPLSAGRHDVEVVFDVPTWARVRGRVVSRWGAPVAGVMVQPRFDAFTIKGTTWVETPDSAYSVTDEEGGFVLESIPHDDVYFRLTGDQIIPTDHGRKEGSAAENLVVVVPLRVDAQVVLDPPGDADRAVFFDDEGRIVPVSLLRFGQRQIWDHAPLVKGRSEVIALSDAATTLVLRRGDQEIRSEPIRLVPSEVNVLR
jgi:hypothetical protein